MSAYALALAALVIWSLLVTVLAPVSAVGTAKARAACGLPVRDYSDPMYRRSRAHLNAVENAVPFVALTLVAVLVGASPFWTNLLACLFVASRIGMAVVHILTENQPMRSAFFAGSLFCTLGLALLAILGVLAL